MGKQYNGLEPHHIAFILAQHLFFVATAAPDGRINLSPKGMDSLRVDGPNAVTWLNLTGSGNETAGHLRQSPRMTMMWCSFTSKPEILRAFGKATVHHEGDPRWAELVGRFGDPTGARQVLEVEIDLVQSSCGYAVPFFDFAGERDVLSQWADKKGRDGVRAYWAERNGHTLDGAPTGVPGTGDD